MAKDALLIEEWDDVEVVLHPVKKGDVVDGIVALEDIPQAHKIARRDMDKGHVLIKYGCPIGILTKPVKKGSWIHSHNLMTGLNERPTYEYKKGEVASLPPSNKTFKGFVRKDGRVGIRNDLILIPTVGCVNANCEHMKREFLTRHPEASSQIKIVVHPYGCSQLGDDLSITRKILLGIGNNPNAGGVLVVGLGCENNRLSSFMSEFRNADMERVSSFNCQDHEDEIAYGVQEMERIYALMQKDQRVDCPLSKLVLGVKCGGSDGFSGLTANPLLGKVAEVIGASGGKVGLTEVPEMFGAEQLLMNRARDEGEYEKIVALINNFKDYYARNGQVCYENPSPGNKDGGITTLEEKSLGCVQKGGHMEVEDVLDYGDEFRVPGLSLVNGPGNDIVACTDLVAAGATLIVFTTGRGTPFGSIVPTIKLATNHNLASKKANWIDFDAQAVFEEGFIPVRDRLLDFVLEVASGRKTKAEENGNVQIAIFKQGVTL